MKQPVHIRLNPKEEEQIEEIRGILSKKLGNIEVTKMYAIHAMLSKGYEVLKT